MSKCKLCKSTEFENNHYDLNESDKEDIALHIKEGYTSGHNGNNEKRIYWELKVNVWNN